MPVSVTPAVLPMAQLEIVCEIYTLQNSCRLELTSSTHDYNCVNHIPHAVWGLIHLLFGCPGPWHRLPLTVRWLKQECATSFPPDQQPPLHMPIAYGLVDLPRETKSKDAGASQEEPAEQDSSGQRYCDVCKLDFEVCIACVTKCRCAWWSWYCV